MRATAVALSLALAACATTPIGNRTLDARRSTFSYGLAQTYYDVRVRATDDQVNLEIAGPYFEASYSQAYFLDLRHSGFAADRFIATRDSHGMLASLTVVSRSQANAIAVNLGSALGAGASLSGGAARTTTPPTPGAEADEVKPAEYVLLERRWRIESEDPTVVEHDIQTAIDHWRQSACSPAYTCTPQSSIVLRAPRVTATPSAVAPDSALCARVLCVSAPARTELGIEVRASGTNAAHPSFGTTRTLTFTDDTVSQSRVDFFDPVQGSLAGGLTHLVFADGALAYVGYARESEVESAVALPFSFVSGALNSIFRVLPIHIAIDIQRHELDVVEHGNYATPGGTGGAVITSDRGAADTRTAPDAPTAPTGVPGARPATTRIIPLIIRQAAAGGGGGGGGGHPIGGVSHPPAHHQ